MVPADKDDDLALLAEERDRDLTFARQMIADQLGCRNFGLLDES